MAADPPSPPDAARAPLEDATGEDALLSERRLALLRALRDAEQHGHPADPHRLARASGYPEPAVRAWLARLEGVLVTRADAASPWRVHGAAAIAPEEFARLLARKATAPNEVLRTEEAWRSAVRKLLYEGQRRHYQLSREELDLVEAVAERRERRDPTAEVPIQPSLFPSDGAPHPPGHPKG